METVLSKEEAKKIKSMLQRQAEKKQVLEHKRVNRIVIRRRLIKDNQQTS